MSIIEIHWSQAQELPDNERSSKAEALNEFRNSYCDMFDMMDWLHISEKTGWSVEKLRDYAKFDHDESYVKKSLYMMLDSELDKDDLINLKQ